MNERQANESHFHAARAIAQARKTDGLHGKGFEVLLRFAGKVHFPIDMLRYDRCTPYGEGDSYEIERSIYSPIVCEPGTVFRVTVRYERKIKADIRAQIDRWHSRGWRCVPCDPDSGKGRAD